MIISVETAIGFDPVDDYAAFIKFKADNDVSQFKQEETTKLIMLVKRDFYYIETKGGSNGH